MGKARGGGGRRGAEWGGGTNAGQKNKGLVGGCGWGVGRDRTQSGSEGVVIRVEEDLSSPREQDSDIVEGDAGGVGEEVGWWKEGGRGRVRLTLQF